MTEVKFVAKSDFEKVKKDYLELARHTAKVESENRKLSQATKEAGRSHKNAFGARAAGDLKRYAAGLVGMSSLVSGVKAVFSKLDEEETKALGTLNSLAEGMRRLNQIATSPEDLASLQKERNRLSVRYGVSPDTVQRVQFQGRSEGFSPLVESIISMNQAVSPEAAAGVAGQVPGLFPGSGLTGKQAINMTFVGAGRSRLDFERTAEALPTIATGAGLAGSTPAETIALASVMAKRFATGKTAADRGKAFGTKVGITDRLKGKGIVGAFLSLRDDFTEEERKKFLGESQELNVFYQILSEELPVILKRREEVTTARQRAGTPQSAIAQAMRRAASDPMFQAQKQTEISKARLDVRRMEDLAAGGAQRATSLADVESAMYGANTGPVSSAVGWLAGRLAKATRMSRRAVFGITAGTAQAFSGMSDPGLLPRVAAQYAVDEAATAQHSGAQVIEAGGSAPHVQAMERLADAVEKNTEAQRKSGAGRAGSSGSTRAAAIAELAAQRE